LFEYNFMNQRATVQSLQQRITKMQPLRTGETGLPTPFELRPLLPGGALRKGATTSVQGSAQLALALLSAASQSGAWCGAIGLPNLGIEAAATLGLRLDRFVLVPQPGTQALTVTGMLGEVLSALILHPPQHTRPSDIERLAAKLREHDTALIVLGDWPRSDSFLHVTASRWSGLGQGFGLLETHDLTVRSLDRRGGRRHTVRFRRGRLTSSLPSISDVPT
jgi:hypothetical protein